MPDRTTGTPRPDSKHHSVYDQCTGAMCVVRMGTVLAPVHKADRMDSVYIKQAIVRCIRLQILSFVLRLCAASRWWWT